MPSYVISKEFHFSASHQLRYLADAQPEHPCARLHGHNYVVVVHIGADGLDRFGFVVDYNLLAPFKTYIDTHVDHRHLNEVLASPSGQKTTAENLAAFFSDMLLDCIPHLDAPRFCYVAVDVKETPKTCARFVLRNEEIK